MNHIVPALPVYALVLGLDHYSATTPGYPLGIASKMVRSRLLRVLEADDWELAHPDIVAAGCMVRLLPPEQAPAYYRDRMLHLVEVVFPHPGSRGADPHEITPPVQAPAVMIGGPDDGSTTTISNLAPEHLRTPYYGANEELLFNPETFELEPPPSIWTEPEPGIFPTLAAERTLLYTRSGYDLRTGAWQYTYQSG